MSNKILKQYIQKKSNEELNYENILKRINHRPNYKKIILNFSMIFIVLILVGIFSMQVSAKIKWNFLFKEYKNKDISYEKIINADDETINMDYVYKNGVKVKIDSIVLLNDYINMKVNFKFDDNIDVNSESFSFGYAIYDENNNIYDVESRINPNVKDEQTILNLYKELGIKYDSKNVFENLYMNSSGIYNISSKDRNIISEIEVTSKKGFPTSKKLFIKIFDLGFLMSDIEKNENKFKINEQNSFNISNAEWVFEINTSEKYYNPKTINLKLENNIENLDINKMNVTQQMLIIDGKIKGYSDYNNSLNNRLDREEYQKIKNSTIYIKDSDNNIYYSKDIEELIENDDTFKCRFEINTEDFESKSFYLYVSIDGKTYNCKIIKE